MDIEKGYIGIKTVVFIIVSAVSLTFSLTTIYWRFGQTEIEIMELRDDIDYNQNRGDRLRKRVEERVTELELPGTDESE